MQIPEGILHPLGRDLNELSVKVGTDIVGGQGIHPQGVAALIHRLGGDGLPANGLHGGQHGHCQHQSQHQGSDSLEHMHQFLSDGILLSE